MGVLNDFFGTNSKIGKKQDLSLTERKNLYLKLKNYFASTQYKNKLDLLAEALKIRDSERGWGKEDLNIVSLDQALNNLRTLIFARYKTSKPDFVQKVKDLIQIELNNAK